MQGDMRILERYRVLICNGKLFFRKVAADILISGAPLSAEAEQENLFWGEIVKQCLRHNCASPLYKAEKQPGFHAVGSMR